MDFDDLDGAEDAEAEAENPRPQEPPIRVVGAESSDLLCEFTFNETWDVMDLKFEVEAVTKVPVQLQHLLVTGRPLKGSELLAGALAADEDETGVLCRPDVVCVKLDPTRAELLSDLRIGKKPLGSLDDKERGDLDLVLAALEFDGMALEHAAVDLRGDPVVVLSAVLHDGEALRFASEKLRDDLSCVAAAVETNGLAIQHASEQLRGDKELAVTAVKQNGFALEHVTEALRDSHRVVRNAVKSDGRAVQYASDNLKYDREIVLAALTNTFDAFQLLPEEVQTDPEVAEVMKNHSSHCNVRNG